jgi:hypothetical protein
MERRNGDWEEPDEGLSELDSLIDRWIVSLL